MQLRPIAGIRPAVYLTAIYSVGAALLLFLLLFYPGLRSRGTYVTFVTRPAGAAITVDGSYRGFTPAEVLVAAGNRTLGLSRPGMVPVTLERSVGGRVFATLFFKPRAAIEVDLEVADPGLLAREGLEKYAAYGHEKANGLISETAVALTIPAVRGAPAAAAALTSYLESSMAYLAPSSGDLSDYLQAWAIHAAGGGVLGPGALAGLVRDLASLGSKRVYWLAWFLLNAPEEVAQHVVQQPWALESIRTMAAAGRAGSPPRPVAGAAVMVSGVVFRPIPGGTAMIGDDSGATGGLTIGLEPPHAVAIRPFYMGETEVTNRQYASFLADTPSWRKTNLERLLSDGLVSDQYLETWDGDRPPVGLEDHPVTHVSYSAALSYAAWLATRLPASLRGYTVRLPWEAEWEWAARGGGVLAMDPPFRRVTGDGTVTAGSTGPNGYGLRETLGNVWEWCADWYAPSAYFLAGAEPDANDVDTSAAIPAGAERVVRGGAWANEGRQVAVYTRGSQPPAWTTAYLGFRVVVVPPSR